MIYDFYVDRPSEELENPAIACWNGSGASEGEWRSPYLDAECLGRSGSDCSSVYTECPISPLEFISDIY